MACLEISILLSVWLAHCSIVAEAENRLVYDAEQDRYFPISNTSLTHDSKLVLPPPDPREFPPEYLQSLLKHLDDPTPGPMEFLQKSWIGLREFTFNWKRYPLSMAVAYRILLAIRPEQLMHVFIVAFLLSVWRFSLQKYMVPFLQTRLGISVRKSCSVVESSHKACCFLGLWLLSFKLLILDDRPDFYRPLHTMKGIQLVVGYFDIPTPPDYYLVYTLQLGFYLHSLWSVLFVDRYKSDTPILFVHHCLTLLLLQFSLVLRLHRMGMLVLFLHDLSDVFLELAKVNVYLNVRNGKKQPIHVNLSNILFFVFTLSWIVMRLYWFPLKVLYATSWGVYINNVGREYRSFVFFNTMLWSLFGMHVYWFRLIVIMSFRLLLRPAAGDVREEVNGDSDTSQVESETPVENGSVIQVGDQPSPLVSTSNSFNGTGDVKCRQFIQHSLLVNSNGGLLHSANDSSL